MILKTTSEETENAHRYLRVSLLGSADLAQYTEMEQRLPTKRSASSRTHSLLYVEGKENEKNKDKWKMLHDRWRVSRVLTSFLKRYYADTQKMHLGRNGPCQVGSPGSAYAISRQREGHRSTRRRPLHQGKDSFVELV